MNLFELRSDGDRYQNLVFESENDWATVRRFDGRSLSTSWTAPIVEIFRDDKHNRNLPPSDFPALVPGVPVFSLRALNVLKDVLEKNGETLQLSCSEGEYYAFNVTTFIDALDESNSEIERFESSGRIMRVLRYAFFGNRLGGATIFKIPQFPRSEVYVTDQFCKMVMDNGLVGFKFVKIWDG